MRSILLNRRFFRIAIPSVLFFALLIAPLTAHALGFPAWMSNPLGTILDLVLSVVVAANSLLGQLLNLAKDLLQWVLTLSLQLVLGLQVIDVAWNVMRDMANLVFVLMLILISFSTIFNVVKGLQRFHYRTALMPVIIAALMMNFSLAIGKAGVLGFDRIARIFINIMPNLGADLTKTLQPQAVIIDPKALVGPLPSNDDAARGVVRSLTAAEDKRFKECLNETKEVKDTDAGFFKYAKEYWFGGQQVRKAAGDCNLEIIAARQGSYKVLSGQPATPQQEAALAKIKASTASNDSEQKIFLIFSGVLSGMLVLLLTLCLIGPCLFLLLRVIMLWVLLFSAPIAWAGYAIPGSDVFKKWWNLFIGWNAFGPVYLFCLIPGMIVLQSSGELLTALGNSSASGTVLGTASGLFQIFMFNAFAVLIFLGGIGVALKSSFAGAVKTTAVLGDLASKAGAFDSTGLGGARFAGKYTPGAATVRARAERAAQQASERIGRTAIGRGLGRAYQAVKPTSYEERLTAARASAGVTGATAEFEKLKAGQVEEARKKLKSASDFRDIPGGKDAKLQRLDYLAQQKNSSDRSVALAAREELLKMNKLRPEEIAETAKMYGQVSPAARRAFEERTRRAPGQEEIERRKKEEAERSETISTIQTQLTGNPAADAVVIQGQLDPIFAKIQNPSTSAAERAKLQKTLRAAEEALGGKDPELLKSYLVGKMPAPEAKERAYAAVLKNPKNIMELPDTYLQPGANNTELRDELTREFTSPAQKAKLREKLRDSGATTTQISLLIT